MGARLMKRAFTRQSLGHAGNGEPGYIQIVANLTIATSTMATLCRMARIVMAAPGFEGRVLYYCYSGKADEMQCPR